ncbi:T9SS type A sorting domain-containing protein [Dyadobacter sp. CY323]|uniref:T9SS type A sorting domain-containing protein n=1 Tax=Dyadobacter sp. CY323 TaxID=2907302 RepID=UPI001F311843|nr:T9SS type A sorting domain-containing protein [Dyadobacter sp. CY323]MCE6987837.1 T9SS type A sorting domain-containing protein [Dyadobacter sp. CY323]
MNESFDTTPYLRRFLATKREDQVYISWSTQSEKHIGFFELQHSINGRNWEQLDRFRSDGGKAKEHSFTHLNPSEADNFYRLKLIYHDKSNGFSHIAHIHIECVSEDNVYPNPVADKLFIRNEDWIGVEKIEILHPSGELFSNPPYTQTINPVIREYDFRYFSEGMYRVRTFTTNGQVKTVKVLKR